MAITYPKHARGQITQMVLRAGRWYENKPIFHILIPSLDEEDLSGFEEVLLSLAIGDKHIRDEIFCNDSDSKESSSSSSFFPIDTQVRPQCIVIDKFNSTPEEIRRCFSNLIRGIYNQNKRYLQDFCVDREIDTSIDYHALHHSIPEMPQDPLSKTELWYDYLHPHKKINITKQEFVKKILEPNRLTLAHSYADWRSIQSVKENLPSVQNITDGIFGRDSTNFNLLREQKVKRR